MKACFDIDHHTDHESRLFSRAYGGDGIYLTKCPKDIIIVGPSLHVDPNLYVICMVRDPRDIICSKHNAKPNKYWASLKFWNTYINFFRRLRGHPRFIAVKYEEFVTNPDEIQDDLTDRIPFLEKKRHSADTTK